MKELSKRELFDKADSGDISILSDPNVYKYVDTWMCTPLHHLARCGKIEVLKHPLVCAIKDYWKETPFDDLCNALEQKYSRTKLKYITKFFKNKEKK